jgi:RTA1 like protein
MQNPVGAFFIFLPTPLLEVVGYGIRNASLNSPDNNGLYMANMIIIGISPIYLTAVNFIVFGALIPFVGEVFSSWKSGALVCVATVLLPQVTHLQTRGRRPRECH